MMIDLDDNPQTTLGQNRSLYSRLNFRFHIAMYRSSQVIFLCKCREQANRVVINDGEW